MAAAFVNLPLELTRHECRFKRKELQRVRDDRARVLGTLADMRASLSCALEGENYPSGGSIEPNSDKLTAFANQLHQAVGAGLAPSSADVKMGTVAIIERIANTTLQEHAAFHANHLRTKQLRRPSRLTLLWPRLLLLPPAAFYAVRMLYNSRSSLAEAAMTTRETVEGLLRGWLFEPLKDVLNTVRAGGEDGVIVRKEGVAADLAVSNVNRGRVVY